MNTKLKGNQKNCRQCYKVFNGKGFEFGIAFLLMTELPYNLPNNNFGIKNIQI